MAGNADEVAAVVEELVKGVRSLAEHGPVLSHDEIRNHNGHGNKSPSPNRDVDSRDGG